MTSYQPARGRPSGRPPAAVLVGVALAVLVLVAVVVSLRTKNDDGGDQAATTTSATSTTIAGTDGSTPGAPTTETVPPPATPGTPDQAALDRLLAATPAAGPLPKGDYAPLCAELKAELTATGAVSPPTDLASFVALLRRFDLTKLARLAPPGVRQSYLDLRDALPAATAAMNAAGGAPDPSALPPRFLPAVSLLAEVALNSCSLG